MQPLLNIAVSAARAAGRVVMKHYRQGGARDIRSKGRNDFVTEVDDQAESAIIDTIRRAHPRHAILAEESGGHGDSEVVWIVDPIDGTANYIRRLPHFCISIACQIRGQLEHGVVYDPFREELFTASRGAGAMLDGRRIRVAPTTHLHSALLATGFAYRKQQDIAAHLDVFTDILTAAGDIRRAGSAALDLAYVAAGRLDGYWEMGLSPWDIAAGLLLVQEAGGIAGGIGGGDALASGNALAGTPKIFAALEQRLGSVKTV